MHNHGLSQFALSTPSSMSPVTRHPSCEESSERLLTRSTTNWGGGGDGGAWILSVEILQARDLPPGDGQMVWVSCGLAVVGRHKEHAHTHILRALAQKSIAKTQRRHRSSSPLWNERFEFGTAIPCPMCEQSSEEPATRPARAECDSNLLDGSPVTLAVGVYGHTEGGKEELLGALILPAHPGAEGLDWYLLLSRDGCPVFGRTGQLGRLHTRVSYARRRAVGVLANWPDDWAPCVPIHSSSSVITLVEPCAMGCGISIMLEEHHSIMTDASVSSDTSFAESFIQDVCAGLKINRGRVVLCGLVRDAGIMIVFNFSPVRREMLHEMQPTPRDLAVALCGMVADPGSALRQAGDTHRCLRIVVHNSIAGPLPMLDPSKLSKTASEENENWANLECRLSRSPAHSTSNVWSHSNVHETHPFTVNVLFEPMDLGLSPSLLQERRGNEVLLPVTVKCLFTAPESQNASKIRSKQDTGALPPSSCGLAAQKGPRPTAGVGLALMDSDGPDGIQQVYVHSIIHGGAAHREGTIQVGDVITFIDGHSIAGLQHAIVRSRVIGDAGTTVRLELKRIHQKRVLDYEVVLSRGNLVEYAFANLADPTLSSRHSVSSRPTTPLPEESEETEDADSQVLEQNSLARAAPMGAQQPTCKTSLLASPQSPNELKVLRVIPISPSTSTMDQAHPNRSVVAAVAADGVSRTASGSVVPYAPRIGSRSNLSMANLPPVVDGPVSPPRLPTSRGGFFEVAPTDRNILTSLPGHGHPSPIKPAEATPLKTGVGRTSQDFDEQSVVPAHVSALTRETLNASMSVDLSNVIVNAVETRVAMAPQSSTSSLSLPNGNLTDRSSVPDSDRIPGRWRVDAGIGRAKELMRLQGGGCPSLFCRVAVVPRINTWNEPGISSDGQVVNVSSMQRAAGTKIVHEDINPVWKEKFTFFECSRHVLNDDGLKTSFGDSVELVVVIFDRNGDEDAFRGIVRINVDAGLSNEGWYTIQSKDGSPMYGPSGSPSQIQVSISYTFEDTPASVECVSPRTPCMSAPGSSSGTKAGLMAIKWSSSPTLGASGTRPFLGQNGPGKVDHFRRSPRWDPAKVSASSPRWESGLHSRSESAASTPTGLGRVEEALL